MYLFQFYVYVLGIIQCINANDVDKAQSGSNRTKAKHNSDNNVILMSFDAFRWDYFDLIDTPVLSSFKKHGVHSKYVKNVIPTITFPNHISLATGLYPESHGFVANDMYDPLLNSTFHMYTTDPKWWWTKRIEPIWTTNEKQGGISGVCLWPGSNIDGYTPTYLADREGKYTIPFHSHDNIMPYQERVDTAIQWLLEDKPPNFLMLYFGMLDTASHRYGFGSSKSLIEVSRLDNITGYLLDQLSKHKLLNKWNIIITGDHGMTNLSDNRVINITHYINISEANIITEGGVVFVWPTEEETGEIYGKLKHAHPHMTVFLKNDIPKRYHIRKSIRTSPIVLILDEGWKVWTHMPNISHHATQATHGFLNTYPSMWPLFIARGPAFKKGYFSAPFESIDIYSLMCKILRIKPHPNNGTLRLVTKLLLSDHATMSPSWNPILVGVSAAVIFFVFGIVIFAIAMCCSRKSLRKFRKRDRNTKVVMSELEQTNSLLKDYDDNDNEEIYVDNENDPPL